MTTLMDGLGYVLMAGLIFLPVLYLAVYCTYEAFGWRQILEDWSYPESESVSPKIGEPELPLKPDEQLTDRAA